MRLKSKSGWFWDRTGLDLRFGWDSHVGVKLKLKFEEVQSLLLKYQAADGRERGGRIELKIIELNLELNPLGRLGIAIRLVRVFAFMHNSPIGKRINCDMTKVTRALSLVFYLTIYCLIHGTFDPF